MQIYLEQVADEHRKNKGEVRLPLKQTKGSAGYDVYSPVDITVNPGAISETIFLDFKAHFPDDMVLLFLPRSSMGRKGVMLSNTIGVIDSSYANNPSNDGNIGVQFYTLSKEPFDIKAGDRVGQIMLVKIGAFENQNSDAERTGGFGSTGV